jgi:hypothetical protein
MQESKHLIWVGHVADPGICTKSVHLNSHSTDRTLTPGSISKSVTEPCNHENDDENWIWRVNSDDNVRNQMA